MSNISIVEFMRRLNEAGEDKPEEPDNTGGDEKPNVNASMPNPKVDSRPSLDAKIDTEINSYIRCSGESKTKNLSNESYRSYVIKLREEKNILNVDVFTADIANLIDNITDIIDMKTIIVKRAEAIIKAKYGDEVAEEFIDDLMANHGISVDETEDDIERKNTAPLAVGAGPIGS